MAMRTKDTVVETTKCKKKKPSLREEIINRFNLKCEFEGIETAHQDNDRTVMQPYDFNVKTLTKANAWQNNVNLLRTK